MIISILILLCRLDVAASFTCGERLVAKAVRTTTTLLSVERTAIP
jgi:hypothetical protein